jgi:hypothetical protein
MMLGQKKKHDVAPADPNYYSKLPIQPGSGFFHALVEGKYPLSTLALHVPEILLSCGGPTLLYTGTLSPTLTLKQTSAAG